MSKLTWTVALGGFVGWLASLLAARKATASGPGGHPYPTPRKLDGVAFAGGVARPAWPVPTSSNNRRWEVAYKDVNGKTHGNASRALGASRGSGSRRHAGIDLYANAGDIVVAPEAGTFIETQNFLNTIPGDDAMLIQTDSGVVLLLGEIKAKSWQEFGLGEGSRVRAGQPVARIGLTSNGSHMLHFETYREGARKNARWISGKAPPPSLLDPTGYLLRARAGAPAPPIS